MEPAEIKAACAGLRGDGRIAALARPGAQVHLAHPFETLEVGAYESRALGALATAFPDLERRVTIEIAGRCGTGQDWLGLCGYWCGLFAAPFLGIPPTRRMAAMRFHEFHRLEAGRIVETQALWDIPELMLQAGAWPLGPSLGREWQVPGPATQDGLAVSGDGASTRAVVDCMLERLGHNREGVAAMQLDRFWHPDCSWYGPSGIGTARGIAGFRAHHQAPFLAAMPGRRGLMELGHLFAEGGYAAFTAWPGMAAEIEAGGWLGIAPAGQSITLRSLDFWRVSGGRIAENWVLVDLLHVHDQIGVDVLSRMRELVA